MVFAVVEDSAEIGDRESSKVAARGGIANAFLDRRNPVFRDCAAENIVHELDAFAALDGLHLDAAHAKLAVPAGLFLVLAFGVGFAANSFTVGNLGRFEREVDVVAFLKFGDDDFDVLLAGARENEFLCLRIA